MSAYNLVRFILFVYFGVLVWSYPRPFGQSQDHSSIINLKLRKSFRSLNAYRLPDDVKPIHYEITLEPMLELDVEPVPFTGTVSITLTPTQNTDSITLHAKNLNYTNENVVLTHSSGTNISVLEIIKDLSRTTDFHVFKLGSRLATNEVYNLTIQNYQSFLSTELNGFYLAKFSDTEGSVRRFATTQFQASDARKAYPCFDEPNKKATFRIRLVRPEGYISISNEKILHTYQFGDKHIDVYNTTVIMSPYLTAFVVAPYASTVRVGIQRVFAAPDDVSNGNADFALQIGTEILEALENRLEIKYSTSKLDQIAIPQEYYPYAGMENWGLITYLKKFLVYPKATATISQLKKTIDLIAHEYAHQWFGNLVTCDWWTFAWLNEGFASYYQFVIAHTIRPDWGFDQSQLKFIYSILYFDSTPQTVPLNHDLIPSRPVLHSNIIYNKGSAIVRMMQHFLTTSVFNKAMTKYLNKYAYNSVKPEDLYQILQETIILEEKQHLLSGLTVSSIMRTWDSQAGYPIVNVKRDYSINIVSLSQERFFNKNYNISDNSIWYIPISVYVEGSNSTTPNFWLTTKSTFFGYCSNTPLMINNQFTDFQDFLPLIYDISTIRLMQCWCPISYYRVNYDNSNWKLIIDYLNSPKYKRVHAFTRAQLLEDSFTLAKMGKLSYTIPLSLSMYIPQRETDWFPLFVVSNAISQLKKQLIVESEFDLFKSYVHGLYGGIYNRLGISENSHDTILDRRIRNLAVTWLCTTGHTDCLSDALEWFKKWKIGATVMEAELESTILCAAMNAGNEDDWEYLYNYYISAGSKASIDGLACVLDSDFLLNLLTRITNARDPNIHKLLHSAAKATPIGFNTAFNFIVENLAALKKINGFESLIYDFCSLLTKQEQLERYIALVQDFHRDLDIMKITTGSNRKWNDQKLETITSWLIENFS